MRFRQRKHKQALFGVSCTMLFSSGGARAQTTPGTPQLVESSGLLGAHQGVAGLGAATPPYKPSDVPGTAFYEVLRGNGTQAGYVLSHGNLIPDTMSVRVAGRILKAGQDYWLDAQNGTLMFTQAVRKVDSVSVYYRYIDGKDSQRQPLSLPGFQLAMGANTRLNLLYGMTPGNGAGFDVSTYGLGLNSKFGAKGSSSYSGLLYFSNVTENNNLILPTSASSDAPKAAAKQETGLSQLILQNLAMKSGGFQFNADYQDVGKNFSGFQALRLNNANNAAMLSQLGMLEGEKGVKRLGFGLGYAPTKLAGGLNLAWNQIQDDKGAITQKSADFASSAFHLRYAERDVSDTFALFSGLREGEKAQWTKEKGMKTTSLGFGMNWKTGSKKAALPGGLDFLEQRFGDKSGSLNRSLWNLTSGGMRFSMLNRRADRDFKRLNDLSDADKTSLVLDLYQQYDPMAKPEQVTAVDKVQVTKEAGFIRDALRADLGVGKAGAVAFSQVRVADSPQDSTAGSAGFQRNTASLSTKNFEITLVNRKTDAGFTRIVDLADVEKTYLALDIRRQFDPDAKLEQVTPKERDQAVRETGLSRSAIRGKFQIGKKKSPAGMTLNQFAISTNATNKEKQSVRNTIRRSAVAYTNKRIQLSVMNQSIGNSFNRLSDLSDLERAMFANERGLERLQLGLLWQLSKNTKLGLNSLKVGGTADAVVDAVASANKDQRDSKLAGKAASAGLRRDSLTLESKGLNLTVNSANTAKDFTRASDLNMTAPEKQAIEAERGFERTDYSAKYTAIKRLTIESNYYNAVNALDNLSRETYKHNLVFTPNRFTTLSYLADGDLARADGKTNGTQHSVFSLNRLWGKGFLFNAYQDEVATFDKSVEAQKVTTDFVQFETPKDKPSGLGFQTRRLSFQDGKFENTTNLNLHAKPVKGFAFSYSQLDLESGNDKKEVNENTNAFDFQWQATKQFAVIGGLSQRDTNNETNGDVVSVGLQGQPIPNLTIAAKFDEVHNVSKNTKDVADIAISNTKPISLGPLTNLVITARYASLNDQRKLMNEVMTGRASWRLWKNDCVLDYGGLTKADGFSTISRIYSFTTDPNPKKWVHGGFLYKVRTLLDGSEKLIRRFTADMRLSKNTNFVYTYGTLPEDDKGNILQVTTADVAFKHLFRADQALLFYYRLSDNATTKILTRSLGFGYESKLRHNGKFEIAYSIDANGFADRYDHSHHFHVAYERQLNADNFLTFSSEIRSHDSKGLVDEIQANVDFRRRF